MQRREFLKFGAAAGVAVAIPAGVALRGPAGAAGAADTPLVPPVPLSGLDYVPKFKRQLRRPPRVDLTRGGSIRIEAKQVRQAVLSGYPTTTLWGYALAGAKPTWPGPTIVARSNRPVKVQWLNKLPVGTGDLAESHLLPVDMTLHHAHPHASLKNGALPLVPHLHGAHVEWESDGYPEAWFTQDFGQKGPMWVKSRYHYDNSQAAGTLWYHDHALGLTRLNVYAGLAGMYLLRDDNELSLVRRNVLPGGSHEIELVFQDRWFTSDGQLRLATLATPPDGVVGSIFCDFLLVNGVPWPVLDVEPRKYRFRLLNGSDSRFYVFQLDDPSATFLQIGTELGMRAQATPVNRIVMGPGERCDVVIDFAAFKGGRLHLLNVGADGAFRGFRDAGNQITNNPNDIAFGFGGPTNPLSTGQVMQFRVSRRRSSKPSATVEPGTPLGGTEPVLTPTNTRKVLTFNGRDEFNRFNEMLGTVEGGTMLWHEPATETPALDSTEVWEIYNTGPVAHPIHIHLVHFQVLDRQPFSFTQTPKPMTTHHGAPAVGATIADITPVGTARPREAFEEGPKDTVTCYPNEVTRVIAKFDRPGSYVWHCHILHHEDHDMMRPIIVS
jgi:spore coat protein A